MKKEFHSLLPDRAQTALMAASKGNLNEVIEQVMTAFPFNFHTDGTLDDRVFFDQPLGPIGKAKYINAAPHPVRL
jgi:hypothetical protein